MRATALLLGLWLSIGAAHAQVVFYQPTCVVPAPTYAVPAPAVRYYVPATVPARPQRIERYYFEGTPASRFYEPPAKPASGERFAPGQVLIREYYYADSRPSPTPSASEDAKALDSVAPGQLKKLPTLPPPEKVLSSPKPEQSAASQAPDKKADAKEAGSGKTASDSEKATAEQPEPEKTSPEPEKISPESPAGSTESAKPGSAPREKAPDAAPPAAKSDPPA